MDVDLKLRGLGLLVPFVNLYLVFKQLTEINELLEEEGLKPCRTKVLYPVWFGSFFAGNRGIYHARTWTDVIWATLALIVSSSVLCLPVQRRLNEFWEAKGEGEVAGVTVGEVLTTAIGFAASWGVALVVR